jgi:hypothetical protein
VRAGLDLVAAVAALKTRASLQTRVGIATGLVVVGDLTGPGEAQERGIVGETPNLAARLQGLAEPNSVVIAESTRKLLTVRASRLMRYKVKSIAALQLALGSLPGKMRVEVDTGIKVTAKTVGELRKVTAWPENLAVTTPQERHADSAVKVSKLNVATRTTPKT